MNRLDLDPELERLGEALRASAAIDLAREERPERTNAGKRRGLRPRVLAGGTLGLAGVATALVLALTAASSPPAFAITRNGDGSVVVQINENSSLPQANAKLTAMGIHEQVTIYMATGTASADGPVTCTPAPGANVSGPPLKVLVGKDGTEVIAPGESAGNTGEGTYHLDRCVITR
ncbi:MAG TPA: hypothetical protein VGF81_09790 [Solirubrobacteraceae bacterium]|jgi:hypothetical protein